MQNLELPLKNRAEGVVQLPGSKSISNRALLLAALAKGETTLTNLLESDDTAVMLESLRRLGINIRTEGDNYIITGGEGRFAAPAQELFVGNSGLTIRTLVPAVAAGLPAGAKVRLAGVARMHERPIGDLVDGLRQLGAQVEYIENEGYPPLEITAVDLNADEITVAGDTSSQFLTGLLQAAPLVAKAKPLTIHVKGELISKPYVEITLNFMARFGVQVQREGWQKFTVLPGQHYTSPGTLAVEGDASSASYFLAAGAIGGGPVRVQGVGLQSVQGDVQFADALALMGAKIVKGDNWIEASGQGLQAITLDCNHIPDAAMTLAVAALFAKGTTRLTGIASWRVKETDRLAAMATELRKVGARVEEGADWIAVTPPESFTPASIATYDDHRMAMCFSLVTIGGTALTIENPNCVAKTFPEYFSVFQQIAR